MEARFRLALWKGMGVDLPKLLNLEDASHWHKIRSPQSCFYSLLCCLIFRETKGKKTDPKFS